MNSVLFITIVLLTAVVYSLYRDSKYVIYFAYGSNTNVARLLERIPNAKLYGTATLRQYTFRMYQNADIEPNRKEKVYGVLWRIPAEQMKDLDEFENNYSRIKVVVDANRPLKAETYVMKEQEDHEASKNYVRMVREGYKENGLPLRQLRNA